MKIFKVLFVLVAVIIMAGCTIANPGNGSKVGQIARITHEGIMCTTTTVLITGKFGGGELHVTIPAGNSDLETKTQKFQDTQEQVEVKYHTDFVKSVCSNDTNNNMMDDIQAHPLGAAQ